MNEESEWEVSSGPANGVAPYKADESSPALPEESGFCYRSFFEASGDGILVATLDGAILEANTQACELLGLAREEVLAARHDEVFDPSDDRLEPALEEQRNVGRFRGELRLLRRDGVPFPAEVSINTYQDGAGKERLGIVFRDITERKRAEEELRRSEAQFRVMVENALDLIALCDPDNTFRYVNPALEQILGYRPEEVLGTVIPDLIHPEDLEGFVLKMSQEIMSGSVSIVGPSRDPMAAQGRLLPPSRHRPGCHRTQAGRGRD